MISASSWARRTWTCGRFGLNYEVSLLAYGGDVTESLHRIMDEYRSVSSVLTSEEWEQRSWGRRWLDSAMRLTSALQ